MHLTKIEEFSFDHGQHFNTVTGEYHSLNPHTLGRPLTHTEMDYNLIYQKQTLNGFRICGSNNDLTLALSDLGSRLEFTQISDSDADWARFQAAGLFNNQFVWNPVAGALPTTTTTTIAPTTTTTSTTTSTTAAPTTTSTTTAEPTTTTTTVAPTTTTSTTTSTTTTTTATPTTTTTTILYSLRTNYTTNTGVFRENTNPTSNIVTTELSTGTQTGAYLYNVAYLHTGLSSNSFTYTATVNGVAYNPNGASNIVTITDPNGTGILQVNTTEQNPNGAIYNVVINIIPTTTTTSTTTSTTTAAPVEKIHWLHWSSNPGYPTGSSLIVAPTGNGWRLNDNTYTLNFDLVWADMVANQGTQFNVPIIEEYVPQGNTLTQSSIPNDTIGFDAIGAANRYYIAIPQSFSGDPSSTALFQLPDSSNANIIFSGRLAFQISGVDYWLYDVGLTASIDALNLNLKNA